MYRLVLMAVIAIIFMAVPASAQNRGGDLNCNGFSFEISDFIMAVQIIGQRCDFDSLQQCTLDEGDVDEDGYLITIADAMTMAFMISGYPFPGFARNPESDTIKVESAIATPGETLELPIYLKTIDTLTAFQISIETDPDYVTVDTLVVLDNLNLFGFSYCSGHIYAYCFGDGILSGDSVTLLPGGHHIADLVVTVNPNIQEPDTTQIAFSNNPELLQYTALSNGPFFTPVTVDGEIQIFVTGIEDGDHDNIPAKLSINAYPNPFNATATIEYGLNKEGRVRIDIYDLLGRKVETLIDKEMPAGQHKVVWDASGYSSGVYFYRIEAGEYIETRKMVYLK